MSGAIFLHSIRTK